MTILIVLLVVAAVAAVGYFLSHPTLPKLSKPKRSTAMSHVLHHYAADSPGYTRLVLREPLGHRQAHASVTARGPSTNPDDSLVEHVIHLGGQKEFDVPTGSTVTFPDGTQFEVR